MNKEYDFCLRCGRKLKNAENRKRGYGVVCFKKAHTKIINPLFNIERSNNGTERSKNGERKHKSCD